SRPGGSPAARAGVRLDARPGFAPLYFEAAAGMQLAAGDGRRARFDPFDVPEPVYGGRRPAAQARREEPRAARGGSQSEVHPDDFAGGSLRGDAPRRRPGRLLLARHPVADAVLQLLSPVRRQPVRRSRLRADRRRELLGVQHRLPAAPPALGGGARRRARGQGDPRAADRGQLHAGREQAQRLPRRPRGAEGEADVLGRVRRRRAGRGDPGEHGAGAGPRARAARVLGQRHHHGAQAPHRRGRGGRARRGAPGRRSGGAGRARDVDGRAARGDAGRGDELAQGDGGGMSGAIERVGVIGAGRMGQPIIGHLARKGFAVQVHDLDPAKQAAVEKRGARWADLRALARESQAILVCVGYDRELRELLSERGLLRDAQRGTIVAVLSTVHPRTIKELAQQAAPSGVDVVDTTVCRGGWAADEGTLLSFVGGPAGVVERLKPVIAAYSSDIEHTGEAGTAQVAKAANNLMLWACLVASHEGLALAHRYGLDVEKLRKALLTSSATNGALENWGNQTMAWAEDDMASVVGIALPQAGVDREICRALKPKRYRLDEYGT